MVNNGKVFKNVPFWEVLHILEILLQLPNYKIATFSIHFSPNHMRYYLTSRKSQEVQKMKGDVQTNRRNFFSNLLESIKNLTNFQRKKFQKKFALKQTQNRPNRMLQIYKKLDKRRATHCTAQMLDKGKEIQDKSITHSNPHIPQNPNFK